MTVYFLWTLFSKVDPGLLTPLLPPATPTVPPPRLGLAPDPPAGVERVDERATD